jgi:hypothetical protein
LNKRQRKKKILSGLNKEERYRRTHCPVCDSEIGVFDEVQQLSSESHAKWFERYFKRYNLEEKLKTSAQKGYTGYLIDVWSVRDKYLRNRLENERTLEMLRERLGKGFSVGYQLTYSKNLFTGQEYVSDKKIHITW